MPCAILNRQVHRFTISLSCCTVRLVRLHYRYAWRHSCITTVSRTCVPCFKPSLSRTSCTPQTISLFWSYLFSAFLVYRLISFCIFVSASGVERQARRQSTNRTPLNLSRTPVQEQERVEPVMNNKFSPGCFCNIWAAPLPPLLS